MRRLGAGRRESDVGEMDDVECGYPAKGMLAASGGGAGCDFQRRSQAETVRTPAWGRIGQAWGIIVDRSNAEGGVKKRVAGRAISPGRCRTDFARASPGGDAG